MIHLLLPKLDTQLSPSLCKAIADIAQSMVFYVAQTLLSISPADREPPHARNGLCPTEALKRGIVAAAARDN